MALVVMAPEKENVKVPAKDEILAVVSQSKTADLNPYVDKFREEPLVKEDLKGGKIVERKENKELGFTELKLSNGVVVALKPTNFRMMKCGSVDIASEVIHCIPTISLCLQFCN